MVEKPENTFRYRMKEIVKQKCVTKCTVGCKPCGNSSPALVRVEACSITYIAYEEYEKRQHQHCCGDDDQAGVRHQGFSVTVRTIWKMKIEMSYLKNLNCITQQI